MKRILLVLMLIAGGTQLQAQSSTQRRADKYYDRLAYAQALPLYEKLQKSSSADVKTMKRLGDCYRNLGQWGKAEDIYGRLANGSGPDAETLYNYAQALRMNGKYPESLQWMEKFHAAQSADSRGAQYVEKKDFIDKITNQPSYFSLQLVGNNSNEADFGACFYKKSVVFASGRHQSFGPSHYHSWNNDPFLDLFVADRSASGQLDNTKLFSRKTNTRYHEGPACFTPDGNTMYFTRNNYFNRKYGKDKKGVNNLKIFRAKNVSGSWVEENLSINSDEFSVGHPALSPDGKYLYFASDMPGSVGETDIFRVSLGADGKLGTPENLGKEINTEGKEMFPFVDGNGNLFFASNGQLSLGGLDNFYAPPAAGSFGKVQNLGYPVNSQWDDFALILDTAGKGYLSSNRQGGKGDDDLYSIQLIRPLKVTYIVKGMAKEKTTKDVLANTYVTLKDAQGNPLQTVTTGADGSYQFEVELGKDYTILGTQEKYFDGTTPFNTSELGEKTEMERDVTLEKDPGLSLYTLITEKATKKPLQGVKLLIIDNITGKEVTNMLTPTSGDFRKPLSDKKVGERISYQIKLEKQGYLAKTVTFNSSITKAGEIKVHESMDLSMDKIDVGTDIGKIIDIKPIYFDLGKFKIRPDAATELDKIVKVMQDNPNMVIELGSHTDCRSSAASNMTLSSKRAKASADYIISKGIDKSRIYGKGYGETKLFNGCACEGAVKSTCSEEEHQKNRRTEFVIVKM